MAFSLEPGDATAGILEAKSRAGHVDKLLGWLFVTFDDKNGPAQADTVPLPVHHPATANVRRI